MMFPGSKFATAAALLMTVGPALAEPFDDHVLLQLACQKAPDPTYTLLTLERGGRIDSATATLMDSATCWPIKPELDLAGLSFSDVCASAEDPLLVELFPDFYWRGPGTSAGTGLALISHSSVEDLAAWAKTQFPDEPPHYTVEPSYRVEAGSEVSCNSMNFSP